MKPADYLSLSLVMSSISIGLIVGHNMTLMAMAVVSFVFIVLAFCCFLACLLGRES